MYKTIENSGEFTQVINKSTFIGFAQHIDNIDEAMAAVARQKKKYPDARHCCWAYLIGEKKDEMRYSDDGEPQGTAGMPILEVLKRRDVTNTVITVTRYFGGILLGAGGLTRAYSSTAAGTLDNSVIAEMVETDRFKVEIEYTLLKKLKNYIEKAGLIELNTEYTDKVRVALLVKSENSEKTKEEIVNLLNGKCMLSDELRFFYPWRA